MPGVDKPAHPICPLPSELFATASSQLYKATNNPDYMDWAIKTTDWLLATDMWLPNGLFEDAFGPQGDTLDR